MHQTLKRFLAKQDSAHTIAQLQAQVDRFCEYYNTVRPSRSAGGSPVRVRGRPPASVDIHPLGCQLAVKKKPLAIDHACGSDPSASPIGCCEPSMQPTGLVGAP
ncbi:MAG: integrase core domain-containing protein [Actinomycetota bacterium]